MSIEIFTDLKLIEHTRISLNECRKLNKFTDFTLKSSDGKEIKVHKNVLWSTSPYFESMFNSDFKECSEDLVYLQNNISMTDLEVIIEYLYTGEAKVPKDRSKIIFEKANFFQLFDLQEFCSKLLIEFIDDENCVEYLKYSELFFDATLRLGCIQYIAKNSDKLLEVYLDELSNNEFEAILSDTHLKISPEKMFTCILNWIKLDLPQRMECIEKLLKNVDLLEISDDFMDVEIQSDDSLSNSKMFSYTLMKMVGKAFRELKSYNKHDNRGNITVVVNRESPSIALSDALNMVNDFLASRQLNIVQPAQLPQITREQSPPPRRPTHPTRPTREARHLRRLSADSSFSYQSLKIKQCTSGTSTKSKILQNKEQKRIFIAYHYSIEKLNLEKNVWEQQNLYRYDKYNYAIASHKHNIYLTGGLTAKSELSSVVNWYNKETNIIKIIPSMLEGRRLHKSVCLNDQIYVCGGETNRGTVEYFDIGREMWIRGPEMKKSRDCFGLVSYDGIIYAVGGTQENSIERFDPRQGEWYIIGNIPPKYNKCKSFCLNNLLYCLDPSSSGFSYDLRRLKLKDEIFPEMDIQDHNLSWNKYDVAELDGKIYGVFRNQLYQYDQFVWKNLRPSYLKNSIESINLCTL